MLKKYKLMGMDDLSAGMVLAEDVRDGHGNVLLPSGSALSEAMLASLQRRGIESVSVVNNDFSEELVRAERERVQQRLTTLFRKCQDDRIATILRQQITEYRSGENE